MKTTVPTPSKSWTNLRLTAKPAEVIKESRRNANRINARASTGPRTAAGKAKAARNAQQHGLSLPTLADPIWSEEIKSLALKICGDKLNPNRRERATRVAAAHIDVLRVRQARHHIMAQALDDAKSRSRPSRLVKHEPQRPECGGLGPWSGQLLGEYAQILATLSTGLTLMDRYERRARSRRKFAIRAFYAACTEGRSKSGV